MLNSNEHSFDDARNDVISIVVVRMAGGTDGVGDSWNVGNNGLCDVESDANSQKEDVHGKEMCFQRPTSGSRGVALESTAEKSEKKSDLSGSGEASKNEVPGGRSRGDGLLEEFTAGLEWGGGGGGVHIAVGCASVWLLTIDTRHVRYQHSSLRYVPGILKNRLEEEEEPYLKL